MLLSLPKVALGIKSAKESSSIPSYGLGVTRPSFRIGVFVSLKYLEFLIGTYSLASIILVFVSVSYLVFLFLLIIYYKYLIIEIIIN